MSEPWYQDAAERYVETLTQVLEEGPLTPRRAEALFDNFLGIVNAPAPEPSVAPFFLHADVLRDLVRELNFPFARDLLDRISTLSPFVRNDTVFYRVRQLGVPGRYPNSDFASGRARYLVRAGTPLLVTRNSPREEARWGFASELSDWTRHETRLAAALSCTEWGGFTLYLTGDYRDFPLSRLSHVEHERQIDFMLAYVSLTSGVRRHPRYGYWRPSHELVGRFEFDDYRQQLAGAKTFASNFLISHPLLLRTARHFVKASMLWSADAFNEDAVAHVMFALEGTLLLFQNAEGLPTDRLDRRALRRIITGAFAHGESLYEFIDEAMGWGGTRARIVHPQLSLTEGWTPFLMADDYYEYHQVVRALLTYLVTGETFSEFRPASAP